MFNQFNARVLVIDDEETVRDGFRDILCPKKESDNSLESLSQAAARLFGTNVPELPKNGGPGVIVFELDEASTGKDGFALVRKACEEKRPYAAIFVDMRMPGWDGLETVMQIRTVDKRAEIIFVTAYSDYSIEEIVNRAGANVSYYCKPFSVEEIEQIATKLVYEWNKTSNLEDLITVISQVRGQQWEIDALLQNILGQVSEILGSNSALLAIRKGHGYNIIAAIGVLSDENTADKYLAQLPDNFKGPTFESQDMLYFTLEEYGIITLFDRRDTTIHSERIYLVRLFLEQAAAAIRNISLQEALMRSEKLSAVGQAISMLSHDLRNTIGTIVPGVDFILREPDNRQRMMTLLPLLKSAAADSMKMVTDVLDFIRNRDVEKTEVDLCDLLAEVKNNAAELVDQQHIALKIECPDGVEIKGDRTKLLRILNNLVRNAAEALIGRPQPEIRLEILSLGDEIQITVSDNGPGIPPEVMDRLFTPFVTVGKEHGTGLGLPIVKQFVDAHGGKIVVNSSSRGTAFVMTLPVA